VKIDIQFAWQSARAGCHDSCHIFEMRRIAIARYHLLPSLTKNFPLFSTEIRYFKSLSEHYELRLPIHDTQ
jgi:hypothetical protein